jgi:chemotaxis protein CheX
MPIDKCLEILSKAITVSVDQCFKTMIPLPVEAGEAWINIPKGAELENGYNCVGVISIQGEIKGSIAVHLNKDFARQITRIMLGTEPLELGTAIYDTVGELANVIVGGAKTEASFFDVDFEISCPIVIRGETKAGIEPRKSSFVAVNKYRIDGKGLIVITALQTV